MCGVAGLVAAPGTNGLDAITGMCDSLAHRGPDDRGDRTWPDHGVTLGHRRLSIIDLSAAGRNPMANEDGSVWVVHNGEIYNHASIRRELERAGHRFASTSDTEVLVHGYEEWGDAHVDRLNGMFAYAVYDRRAPGGRLVLVRDRLGIKPLHYVWDGSRLAFASEIKSLLRVPWVSRAVDATALLDYLTYLYVPAPKTAFAGIRKLRPGERLVLERGGVRTERYWTPDPGAAVPPEDAVEEVTERLRVAVERHMVADVPVGVFLSGGVDSSAVAAMMAELTDRPVHAFSIGFDVAERSETPFAATVAAHLGLEHRTRSVGVADVRDALEHVVSTHDEPFADASSLPTAAVARLAREEVKVALAGDGGDEVFGGYWWYAAWRRGDAYAAVPASLRRAASTIAEVLPRSRDVTWLRELGASGVDRYASLVELFSPIGKRAVLGPALAQVADGYDDRWHVRDHWRDDLEPGTRMQLVDISTYLPGDILTKVDRASMAVSLEVRPPLLDHELVESVLRMPDATRGSGKSLLRRVVRDRLPAGVLDRPKRGFSVPWPVWIHDLRGWVAEELRDGALVQGGLLAPDPVARLDGRRLGPQAWALVVLERWYASVA